MWIHVTRHFELFLSALRLRTGDRDDADGKAERVAKSLFAEYYPNLPTFNPDCYVQVGSYGKGTAGRPCTDLDMLFVLPVEVYTRINNLQSQKQSQLLQEVRDALLWTFPRTNIRADGQVVLAPFDSYSVEIIPAFRLNDGSFLTAHTANGGSWRHSNPVAEYNLMHTADLASDWKATRLTMMLKAWKNECNVELKSISLEVLATVFINQWAYRNQSVYWYDWMIRDFFAFMTSYVNGRTRVGGTEEWIDLGDSWATKVNMAYTRALKACEYEYADNGELAAAEWEKIFGPQFKDYDLPSYIESLLLRA